MLSGADLEIVHSYFPGSFILNEAKSCVLGSSLSWNNIFWLSYFQIKWETKTASSAFINNFLYVWKNKKQNFIRNLFYAYQYSQYNFVSLVWYIINAYYKYALPTKGAYAPHTFNLPLAYAYQICDPAPSLSGSTHRIISLNGQNVQQHLNAPKICWRIYFYTFLSILSMRAFSGLVTVWFWTDR